MFDIYWSLYDSFKWDIVSCVSQPLMRLQSIVEDWFAENALWQGSCLNRLWRKHTWVESVLG